MKFSIEFTSMRDFLTSFPKLATLISGDGSPEERFAAALADRLREGGRQGRDRGGAHKDARGPAD